MTTPLETHIADIINPAISHLGYALVRVRFLGGKSGTLQIMAERLDGKPMRVEDCERISHQISPMLDVEDVIRERYQLEVSSPGIDRPLVKLQDFSLHEGLTAKIACKDAMDGQRNFRGVITKVEGEVIHLETEEHKQVAIPYENIGEAKLILNDALLEFVKAKQSVN